MNIHTITLPTVTYPIDDSVIPHIPEARKYYEKEYALVEGPRKTSMRKSIKYFGFLARWYHGAAIEMLSKEADVATQTMSKMLLTTEYRIKMYLKLKAQGAL